MATKGKINVNFQLRYVGAIGANRYVANAERYSTIAYRDILQYASRAAHVPESAVDVAMEALFDALSYFVLNGHNVKIDGLGTFSFGVNAKAEVNEADAGADAVRRLKIDFLPEMDLRRDMNNVAITTSWSNPGNLAEDTNASKFSLSSIRFGSSAQNARVISQYGVNYIEKGNLYLVLEGEALNEPLDIVIQGVRPDDEDPSRAKSETISINEFGDAMSPYRVSHGYGKATFKIPVENNFYAYKVSIASTTASQQIERYFSLPENGIYTQYATSNAKVFSASFNSYNVTNNMTVLPNTDGSYILTVSGPNVRLANVQATGAQLAASSSQVNNVVYRVVPSGSSFTLSYKGPEDEQTFNINVGASTQQVVINSLSANGVSINNGGSSSIIAGNNYNFTFNGQNLNLLSASDVIVPAGSSIVNFAKSANQISFLLQNAQEGDISVSYNGSQVFSVSVTVYTPAEGAAHIDTIGGVGNNGSYDMSGISGNSLQLKVTGTSLTALKPADFKCDNTNYTFSLNEGTATERTLTINTSGGWMSTILQVMNGDTTIFKVEMNTGGSLIF